MGIEPTPSAWKAEVLPLNYTRSLKRKTDDKPQKTITYRLSSWLLEEVGFEPTKANAGRFTVCSLWPLGHSSHNEAYILKHAWKLVNFKIKYFYMKDYLNLVLAERLELPTR